jgi:AcrR family transcriptional regulator
MTPVSLNRQKLIDAAVNLFSLNGYDGVSIRDLCREVGIKESSFYNHFHSKDELLALILETIRQRFRSAMPAEEMLAELADLGEADDFWHGGLKRFLDMLADPEMRRLSRILTVEQYRNPLARAILQEELIQRPQQFTALACEKFIAQGKIRPYAPRQLAQEYHLPLVALLLQYLARDAAGEDTAPIVQQCADHIRFFSRMVKAL